MKAFLRICALLFTGLSVITYSQGIDAYKYVSPLPNSKFVTKETNIILRYGEKIDRSTVTGEMNIQILGENSGIHNFGALLSDDEETMVLNIAVPFQPGETVKIIFNADVKTIYGQVLPSFEYSFNISPLKERLSYSILKNYEEIPDKQTLTLQKVSPTVAADSIPSDFPQIEIKNINNNAPGYVFITTSSIVEGVGYYLTMIKDDGTPYYYKKFDNHFPADFKMQPNGFLSYADMQNDYFYAGGGEAVHILMDSSYAVVDSFKMGNGYVADGHDFLLLPNGHALMFAYDLQQVDMSALVPGGKPNAYVAGSVIQEVDVEGNVVFQWRSWDHVQITESYFNLTLAAFDPIHANSIEFTSDGNILASFRNISQVIKINRATGEMIWRLGGKENEFTFINEHAENAPLYFSRPHGVSELNNGNITLFDNGLDHSPQYSRAVEYKIDETNKTAELVWEYKHPMGVYGATQGSVQRLSNGNTLICWGSAPKANNSWPGVTEVHPDGTIAYEMYFKDNGMLTLHAFRHLWKTKDYSKVTEYEILQGNEYQFNNSTDSTFTTLNVNSFNGSGYNSVTVTNYPHAPYKPEFENKAPIVLERRIVINANEIYEINCELSFYASKVIDRYNAESIVIYQRDIEGNGVFVPLNTTYNNVTKQLSANITKFGEFIFCIPDNTNLANLPTLTYPANSSTVNQTLPLELNWTPNGYVNSYQLQVALNPQFENPIIDAANLTEAFFVIDSLTYNSTYYWRVKSFNSTVNSDWSETFSFTTVAPEVQITIPNGGEKFQRGLKHYIKWNDNIAEDVVIELLRNNEVVSVIDTTSSSGVYQWSVSQGAAISNNYKIKIKSLIDETLFDYSDYTFEIIDTTTSVENEADNIYSYRLEQCYPNPFNPSTTIEYMLPNVETTRRVVFTTLKVYDILGREIATLVDEYQQPGKYSVKFNVETHQGASLPSGIYFYTLMIQDTSLRSVFKETKKMLLMK
ncbi:MAG: aryl-sulfate sulfotransferase [Bacteroidota bacterium]